MIYGISYTHYSGRYVINSIYLISLNLLDIERTPFLKCVKVKTHLNTGFVQGK